MSDMDFEQFFNAIPANYLVYDLDWNIVAVTDATLGDTLTRQEVIGRNQFDVFPDNPDAPEGSGRKAMEAALQRVIDERAGHEMPVTRYDIADESGVFRARYFKPVNQPVFDSDGNVTHVIHGVVDVTEAHVPGGGSMTTTTAPDVPITLIGGPTALIEYAGLRILTDPTFDEPQAYGSDLTGYEGYTIVKTESPAMQPEELGTIDVVLASHEHFDNLDLSGRRFCAGVQHVFTTDVVADIVPGAEALVDWDMRQVTSATGQVVTFTAVPAHHGPEGIWQAIGPVIGFVIESPGEKTIYFSGDNSDVDIVREVSDRFPNIEIALLNVGGPKFVEMLGDHYITFSDETAADATEVLAGATIIPVHADSWGHFTQTTASMKAVAETRGVAERVVALAPGQSTTA